MPLETLSIGGSVPVTRKFVVVDKNQRIVTNSFADSVSEAKRKFREDSLYKSLKIKSWTHALSLGFQALPAHIRIGR